METMDRLAAVCQFTFCAACVAMVNRCIFPLRSEQKVNEQTVFLKATGTKVSEPKPAANLTTCALLCEGFPLSMPLPPTGKLARSLHLHCHALSDYNLLEDVTWQENQMWCDFAAACLGLVCMCFDFKSFIYFQQQEYHNWNCIICHHLFAIRCYVS